MLECVVSELMIKPKGQPIFSEQATTIRPAIERMLNLAQEQDRLVYPNAAKKCWICKERDAAPDTGTCARCEDHEYFDVADSEIGGTD